MIGDVEDELITYIPDRLYLTWLTEEPDPAVHPDRVYFTMDYELAYNRFHLDFGPLNLSHIYRFTLALHDVLGKDPVKGKKKCVFWTQPDSRSRANAACLLGCYIVLVQDWTPHLALIAFTQIDPPFMPFRDAGYSKADYTISIQDCVYGAWRARQAKLVDIRDLDYEEYEWYERVENGDFNWITPNFIAFASPSEPDWNESRPYDSHRPLSKPFHNVVDYFKEKGVALVVRLNQPLYDKRSFESRGIAHKDMYFDDGTCPDLDMVRYFIRMVEPLIDKKKAIAVHCKAGLGRTGCLIGAYLIYKHHFTANEVIAFMRIMRPGMVVGPQQHWLHLNQHHFNSWKYKGDFLGAPHTPAARLKSLATASSRRRVYEQNEEPTTPTRVPLLPVDPNVREQEENVPLPAPTPGQPRKTSAERDALLKGARQAESEDEEGGDEMKMGREYRERVKSRGGVVAVPARDTENDARNAENGASSERALDGEAGIKRRIVSGTEGRYRMRASSKSTTVSSKSSATSQDSLRRGGSVSRGSVSARRVLSAGARKSSRRGVSREAGGGD